MNQEDAEADFLAARAQRPAARAPATFSEIWQAEWASSGLDTLSGSGAPLEDAYEELLAKAEAASGRKLRMHISLPVEDRLEPIRDAVAGLDDDKRKEFEPLLDVRGTAARKAAALERAAEETRAVTYGLSGVATAFVAGISRHAVDPINLASMPLGGPLKGPVFRMLGREFGVGAVSQGVQEPVIQKNRAELGLDSGFGQAARNVLEAGIGNAGLAGLFRAGAAGVRYLRGASASSEARAPEFRTDETAAPAPTPPPRPFNPPAPRPLDPPAARALDEISPDDLQAVARVAERDAIIDNAIEETRPRSAQAEPGIEITRTMPHPESTGRDLVTGVWVGRDATKTLSVDGKVVATADLILPQEAGGRITIQKIYVEKAARRKGYASRLVNDLLAEFPNAPITTSRRTTEGAAFFKNTYRSERTSDPLQRRSPAQESIEHAQKLEDAAKAIEQRRPLAAATEEAVPIETTPPPKRGFAKRDPQTLSLLEFLASKGGLRPDPELAVLFGGKNPFIPQFGRLIRKDGMGIDQAREAATLDRYLVGEATGGDSNLPADLLNAIDAEARGGKIYRSDYNPPAKRDAGRERSELERHRAGLAEDFDARMAALGITEPTERAKKRALQIMEKEGETDPLLAYERALMEDEQRFEEKRRVRQTEQIDLPGWDVADDGGGAPAAGGRAGAGSAGPSRDAGLGEGAPGDRDRAGSAGKPVGDQAIAQDAERALAERGDDLEITLIDEAGNLRKVSAREAMREAEEEAKAAAEFKNCVGGDGDDDIPF